MLYYTACVFFLFFKLLKKEENKIGVLFRCVNCVKRETGVLL